MTLALLRSYVLLDWTTPIRLDHTKKMVWSNLIGHTTQRILSAQSLVLPDSKLVTGHSLKKNKNLLPGDANYSAASYFLFSFSSLCIV
jgi:hypothetical protein